MRLSSPFSRYLLRFLNLSKNNMDCEILYKEYKQLKTKVRSIVIGSQKDKPNGRINYREINYRNVLKIRELATELTSYCKNFVKKLPATDRYDLKNDISD